MINGWFSWFQIQENHPMVVFGSPISVSCGEVFGSLGSWWHDRFKVLSKWQIFHSYCSGIISPQQYISWVMDIAMEKYHFSLNVKLPEDTFLDFKTIHRRSKRYQPWEGWWDGEESKEVFHIMILLVDVGYKYHHKKVSNNIPMVGEFLFPVVRLYVFAK